VARPARTRLVCGPSRECSAAHQQALPGWVVGPLRSWGRSWSLHQSALHSSRTIGCLLAPEYPPRLPFPHRYLLPRSIIRGESVTGDRPPGSVSPPLKWLRIASVHTYKRLSVQSQASGRSPSLSVSCQLPGAGASGFACWRVSLVARRFCLYFLLLGVLRWFAL
jgi:hypothetical protein